MSISKKRNTIDDNFNVTYLEEDVKDSVSKLKDAIVENDIYTVDEIFRLINEEFDFCVNHAPEDLE